MKPYFLRVSEQSPTMFWINNPTRRQADLALENGALGCTNNPSYTQKMIDHPEENSHALAILDQTLREVTDDRHAAVVFQARMVRPIAEKFMPLYEKSGGQHGYVSIQGDPIDDEDADLIVRESLENRKIAPNICCKIPVIPAGIAAMQHLVPQDVPLNATEVFGISQVTTICDTYERVSKANGRKPMFYMSHIAGIYDDFLGNYVKEHDVQISPDVLHQAGLAVARKAYDVLVQRGYNATFIGGGARGLHHFTEMVGGRVCITINWQGTADKLLEQNPPVVYRLFNPVPQKVIDELMEKLPDFKRGYLDDGLSLEEYADFGPVQLFRSSFLKSWYRVLDVIQERRALL
ncbi:MAG: transaldolase family protein [Chloroflexota bacterium]